MFAFAISWAGFLYLMVFIFSSDQPVLTYAFPMDHCISGLTTGATRD